MVRIEFVSRLEKAGPDGAWTFAYLPKEASAQLGSKGMVRITGSMDGFPFLSNAFPTGNGTHQIQVNKRMMEGAMAEQGQKVTFAIEVETRPRKVTVPADLRKKLKSSKTATAYFEQLSYSHQKAYVNWITDAKTPETREKRVTETVARLRKGLKRRD